MMPGRRAVLAEILAAIGEGPKRVACAGPPALGLVLARAGHSVLAWGKEVRRLAAARRRAARGGGASFGLVRADLRRLPVGDGALEAIVYAGALPLPAEPLVLEWERALADGGAIVVVTSVRPGLGARLRARLGGTRLRPFSAEDMTRLLLCGGFADVSQVWPRGSVVVTAARARKLPG